MAASRSAIGRQPHYGHLANIPKSDQRCRWWARTQSFGLAAGPCAHVQKGATVVKKRRGTGRRGGAGQRGRKGQGRKLTKARRGRSSPLVQTHQRGDRRREEWLEDLAHQSAREGWSLEKAEIEVRKAAEKAVFAGNLNTQKSFDNVVAEGRLAAHPDIRDHVPCLIALRDEAWARESAFLRNILHGPSQILVDLMRRQRDAGERQHTKSVAAYLAYLRQRFAA